MMLRLLPLAVAAVLVAVGLSMLPVVAGTVPTGFTVTLESGTAAEQATEKQLRRVLERFDLRRYVFTRTMNGDGSMFGAKRGKSGREGAVPLSERSAESPDGRLLSSFRSAERGPSYLHS